MFSLKINHKEDDQTEDDQQKEQTTGAKRSTAMSRDLNYFFGYRRANSIWLMVIILLTVTHAIIAKEAIGSELRTYFQGFPLDTFNRAKKNGSQDITQSFGETRKDSRKLFQGRDGYGFISAAANPIYIIRGSTGNNHTHRGPAYMSTEKHDSINSVNKTLSFLNASSYDDFDLSYLLFLLNEDDQRSSDPEAVSANSLPSKHSFVQKPDNSDRKNSFEPIWRKAASETELPSNSLRLVDDKQAVLKNKISLFSTSLNVLDGAPENTHLAHSVLLVHRPNKYWSTKRPNAGAGNSPTAMNSNHVPQNFKPYQFRPFYKPIKVRLPPKPSTTTTTLSSVIEEDEAPIIVKSNHKISYAPWKRKTTTEFPSTMTTEYMTTTSRYVPYLPTSRPTSTTTIRPSTKTRTSTTTTMTSTTRESTTYLTEIPTTTIYAYPYTTTFKSVPITTKSVPTTTESAPITSPTKVYVVPPTKGPTTPRTTTISSTIAYPTSAFLEKKTTVPIETITQRDKTSTSRYSSIIKPTRKPIKINHIYGTKIKYPDNIQSHKITIVDPNDKRNSSAVLVLHTNVVVSQKPATTSTMATTSASDPSVTSTQSSSPVNTPFEIKNIQHTGQEKLPNKGPSNPSVADSIVEYLTTSTLPTISSMLTTTKVPIKKPVRKDGFVHAILAPPLPSRPMQRPSRPPPTPPSIFSNIANNPAYNMIIAFIRTIFYSVAAYFFPPLALAAFFLT